MRVWTNEGGKGRYLEVDGKIFKYNNNNSAMFYKLTDETAVMNDVTFAIVQVVYPLSSAGIKDVYKDTYVAKRYNITSLNQLRRQHAEEFI